MTNKPILVVDSGVGMAIVARRVIADMKRRPNAPIIINTLSGHGICSTDDYYRAEYLNIAAKKSKLSAHKRRAIVDYVNRINKYDS